MSDFKTPLSEYLSNLFKYEDDFLTDLIEQQRLAGGPMMNIGADQAKLIEILINVHKPLRVLEIGSYFGYSGIWMARALKYNYDKAFYKEGEKPLLTCVEKSSKQIDIIRSNFRKADLECFLELIQSAGIDYMKKLSPNSFDLIFIDADKNNYPEYLKLAEGLLKQGALLLVDNVLGLHAHEVLDLENKDLRIEAIRQFNRDLAESKCLKATIIGIQAGLAIALKM